MSESLDQTPKPKEPAGLLAITGLSKAALREQKARKDLKEQVKVDAETILRYLHERESSAENNKEALSTASLEAVTEVSSTVVEETEEAPGVQAIAEIAGQPGVLLVRLRPIVDGEPFKHDRLNDSMYEFYPGDDPSIVKEIAVAGVVVYTGEEVGKLRGNDENGNPDPVYVELSGVLATLAAETVAKSSQDGHALGGFPIVQ